MTEIRIGDALTLLREMESESVQTCITSPPYFGLRDYGLDGRVWGDDECEHDWGAPMMENATNHTDKRRWQHTRNGRDEEQPPEKRVAWRRTDVDQGSLCEKCGAWFGSLGLEPTPGLYVAHLVEVFREVRRALRDDGTLWLNLGDSYNAYNGGAGPGSKLSKIQTEARPRLATGYGLQVKALKPKDLLMMPARVAIALQEDGWTLRSEIIWAKPNPMPESVTDRPTKAHEQVFLLSKGPRYFYNADAIREQQAEGTAERYEAGFVDRYAQAASGGYRGEFGGKNGHQFNPAGRNKRSVWTVATKPYPEAHFATFPPKLIEPMVLAGCPRGGVVLDPFAGSGTTLQVAIAHGRSAIGIELNPEYAQLARNRLAGVTPSMFDEVSR